MNKHRKTSRLLQFSIAFLFIFSFNLWAKGANNLFNPVGKHHLKLDKELKELSLVKTAKEKREYLLTEKVNIKELSENINSTEELATSVVQDTTQAQVIDVESIQRAKDIFNRDCAACHKLEGALIGPELYKIGDKREKEWLKAWIKDNNALVASGDKLAKEVQDSNPAVMIPFPSLSDQDLEDLLHYFDVGEIKAEEPLTKVNVKKVFGNPKIGVLPVLQVVLLLFLLLSFIVTASSKTPAGSVLRTLIFSPFLKFLTLIFVLLAGAWLVFGWLMQIDVNEGYQPIQPIAFSHAVHAGDNKIDCEYCHSSAKHSKTSGVPTADVCMNCHKSISEYKGELFGDYTKKQLDAEIQKIYDAVGWDKEKMQYIEGYEQKPIKWVRIHKLADFVYYNHSQHVTAGGLECQQCHGPVEEMHDMRQFSPLTMGWCIDCHRDTNVAMEGNEYYKKIHEQLAKKYGVEKVTVAEMGGTECGKCHY